MKISLHEIGKIVRFHRKKAGLTQLQLAYLAGVGKTVIYDIEKEKFNVQLNTLFKVLVVLNTTINLKSPVMNEYKKVSQL